MVAGRGRNGHVLVKKHAQLFDLQLADNGKHLSQARSFLPVDGYSNSEVLLATAFFHCLWPPHCVPVASHQPGRKNAGQRGASIKKQYRPPKDGQFRIERDSKFWVCWACGHSGCPVAIYSYGPRDNDNVLCVRFTGACQHLAGSSAGIRTGLIKDHGEYLMRVAGAVGGPHSAAPKCAYGDLLRFAGQLAVACGNNKLTGPSADAVAKTRQPRPGPSVHGAGCSPWRAAVQSPAARGAFAGGIAWSGSSGSSDPAQTPGIATMW